jgi:PREDICTED: similar to golgi associated PDZ domain and coiled-coil motif containing protein
MSYKTNLITSTGLKWMDILEKEFDKAFVDLDEMINEAEEFELIGECREKLATLCSTFSQLTHKCSVIFENNSKLENDYKLIRDEIIQVKSEKAILEKQLQNKINQLKTLDSTWHSKRGLDQRLRPFYDSHDGNINFNAVHAQEEINQLRKENLALRKYLVNFESELFGARLAAKCLNKELSGRIQQIQLLIKSDLKGQDQERLWNQIEAEIYLHRHKTVVRACLGKSSSEREFPSLGDIREVTIERNSMEGLGISFTGGKEHGIPILISEIHRNTPASRCGSLYVGDAILSINGIDLRQSKHLEAVEILSNEVRL